MLETLRNEFRQGQLRQPEDPSTDVVHVIEEVVRVGGGEKSNALWLDKYAPRHFMDLLSDDVRNVPYFFGLFLTESSTSSSKGDLGSEPPCHRMAQALGLLRVRQALQDGVHLGEGPEGARSRRQEAPSAKAEGSCLRLVYAHRSKI